MFELGYSKYGRFSQMLRDIAASVGTSVKMPIIGLLMLISSCLGKSRYLEVKDGYKVAANLFLVVVAKSGSGKTPALKPFVRAINKAELKTGKRILFSEVTSAAMRELMAESDRGICYYRDELSGFFELVRKDRNFATKILESHDLATIIFSHRRHCNEPGKTIITRIPEACLTIAGTIQPEVLNRLIQSRNLDDGLIYRFLYLCEEESDSFGSWSWDGIKTDHEKLLYDFAGYLLSLEPSSNCLHLSVGAKNKYQYWYEAITTSVKNEKHIISVDELKTAVKKISDQVFRIALMFKMMEQFMECSDNGIVSESIMSTATEMGTFFFLEYKKMRLITLNKTSEDDEDVIDILRAIVACNDKRIGDYILTHDIMDKYNENCMSGPVNLRSMGKKLRSVSHLFGRARIGGKIQKRGIKATDSSLDAAKEIISKYDSLMGNNG